MMKICFIGLGSIGTRHLNNLITVLEQRGITYEIDAMRSSDRRLEGKIQECIKHSYSNYGELTDDYDIMFITNPTYLHYRTLQQVILKTKHLFIEKPIFHTCDLDIEELIDQSQGVHYVACPLRYTPIIKYAKKYVSENHIFAARAICSSYLPEWRKGIDYREIYSAKKEEGGGVGLDLIHEWDYLLELFGRPSQVINVKGKYSNLEIDSDDLAIYIGKYSDKVVEVHLDYFGRKVMRQLTLYADHQTIYLDMIHNTVEICGENSTEIYLEKEDMYMNEMNAFIDMIEGKKENTNTIKQAMHTLKIAIGEGR